MAGGPRLKWQVVRAEWARWGLRQTWLLQSSSGGTFEINGAEARKLGSENQQRARQGLSTSKRVSHSASCARTARGTLRMRKRPSCESLARSWRECESRLTRAVANTTPQCRPRAGTASVRGTGGCCFNGDREHHNGQCLSYTAPSSAAATEFRGRSSARIRRYTKSLKTVVVGCSTD